MPTVKVNQSPKETTAKAEEEKNVAIDTRNRRIVLRELEALEESRVIRAIGAENAMNPAFVYAYALPVASVAEIDGEKYSVPASLAQLEGMIKILGKDGLNAVIKQQQKNSEEASGDNAETDKEAIKN